MITETHTWTLLCAMMDNLFQDATQFKKANYSTNGAECVLEYKGEFYRVSVQHMAKPS